MLKRLQLNQFEDFWAPLAARPEPGAYFCRVAGYSPALEKFLQQALEKRAQLPMRLTGKLQNPDGSQLAYLRETLGEGFACDPAFFDAQLKKWLPRLSDTQRQTLSASIHRTLLALRAQGKNDNMLRNAYLKFLCWMYYRFEQLLHRLGQDPLPRILYDGQLSAHELQLFCVLADAGCDILLIQTDGGAAYQKIDPQGHETALCGFAGDAPFPAGFSLEARLKAYRPQPPAQPARPAAPRASRPVSLAHPSRPAQPVRRPAAPAPQSQGTPSRTPAELFPAAPVIAVNTWLTGDLMADSLKDPAARGPEKQYIYTMFARILGVSDRSSYARDLFLWRKKLEDTGRHVTVLEGLPIPTPGETAKVGACAPQSASQVIAALLPMLQPTANAKLDAAAGRAFVELLTEMERAGESPMRIKNRAIYLICWFNRYFRTLFEGYTSGKLPVLLYFGICRTAFEALFLRFLARLPLDVIEVYPEHASDCRLADKLLFDRIYEQTLHLDRFPQSADAASYSTAAFHAEQELNDTLYQDSGLYRAHQYQKATAVALQTMCEEICILWDKEALLRPGFEVVDDTVLVPVLTAKVSGVKGGDVSAYWSQVKRLGGEDTLFITRLPYLKSGGDSRLDPVQFIKNRKIQRAALQNSPAYPYGLLRPEVQDFLLDKAQALLDSGRIRGTFSQGMEYKILSTAMNLPKDVVRVLQKTDFTKNVPKIAVVATGEAQGSLEDAIFLALMHLCCFDVVLFVPTGYQIVEKYYAAPLFTEHQAGEYLYDLQPPYLGGPTSANEGIFTRFFRRGH